MENVENTEGGIELDPKRCSYVYPEGHEKAGLQCQGMRGAAGYCGGHTKALGLAKSQTDAGAQAPPMSMEQAAEAAVAAHELAQLSLSRRAAEWLAKPQTQRRLEKRWDAILDGGSDTELIRLVKELTDRVEGRATEHTAEPELVIPADVEAIRAMTPAERRALLLRTS